MPNGSAFASTLMLVSVPSISTRGRPSRTARPEPSMPVGTGSVAALVNVLLPSFVAQISFIHGVALIGPGRAGVFVNLVPVFASIMAVIFLQEVFELYHALALALVDKLVELNVVARPNAWGKIVQHSKEGGN